MNGSLHEMDDYGEAVRIRWKNLILPALTLGIRPLGVITHSVYLKQDQRQRIGMCCSSMAS